MPLPGIKKGTAEKLENVSVRMTSEQLEKFRSYSEFMCRPVGELGGELIAYAIGKDADFAKHVAERAFTEPTKNSTGSKSKVA